jgi:two-component system invasion response regulator UvrY
MIRLGLADPCPLIRFAMKQFLRKVSQLKFAWDTDDILQVHKSLRREPVQLLILDPVIRDDRDALRRVEHLRRDFPATRLVLYTHAADDDFALSALRAGASGVLGKDCAIQELLSALRMIALGKIYLSPAQTEEISSQFFSDVKRPWARQRLSAREREVLEGIRNGKRLKEIASDLFLSPKTVHTYKTRLMRRFHLRTNADLIRFAQQLPH